MSRTRIKICGITRPEDARAAVHGGADALGLVFYPKSPRAVSLEQAREIAAVVPPFVTLVGLFVDEPAEQVKQVLEAVPLGLLQFHGDEQPAYCQQFSRPWIKALRVQPDTDIAAACRLYSAAQGLLLDAWQEGVPGGTGKTFDWSLARPDLSMPVVLAGGLNPANVGSAIARVRPVAVDVSGGVELEPGIKNAQAIKQFVAAVTAADEAVEG